MAGLTKCRATRGKVCQWIERCGVVAAVVLCSVALLAECSSRKSPNTVTEPPTTVGGAPLPAPAPPALPTPAPAAAETAAPESWPGASAVEEGVASWYGPGFDGKVTANG